MKPAVQCSLLTASLAALFGAGLWAGMALGEREASGAPADHGAVRISAAPSAAQWAEEAALSLTESLGLTPAHSAIARKHLAGISEELFRDRDRAQFQIHLRLLKVHDLIGNELVAGTSQAVKLKASREKLRLHILDRFQRYLAEHPEAGPLLSSSLANSTRSMSTQGIVLIVLAAAGLIAAFVVRGPRHHQVSAAPEKPLPSRPPVIAQGDAGATAGASAMEALATEKDRAAIALLATAGSARPWTPPAAPAAAADPPASLEEMAARVEQEANHELKRLVPLLNLTPQQQENVFRALATSSPSWQPVMQIASDALPAGAAQTAGTASAPGTAAKSDPLAAIMPLLTPDQQSTLLQAEMDREAWWEEMLPQLLGENDGPGIPTVTAPAATPAMADPAGEIKEFNGADMLE